MAVFFGLDERTVDDVLEHVVGLGCTPNRCFVFGGDMPLLAALAAHWEGSLDLTIVHMPRPDEAMLEAADFILTGEGAARECLVWVHDSSLAFEPPPGVHAAISAEGLQSRELGQALASAIS